MQATTKTFDAVQKLATTLIAENGLDDWHFEWSRGKRMAGQCVYNTKAIRISRYMITSPHVSLTDVKNIILHEIAHALTPGHQHDEVWRQKAIAIGCDGQRCHSHGDLIEPAYQYSCACGACSGKVHRRTQRMRGLHCTKCKSPLKFTTPDEKKTAAATPKSFTTSATTLPLATPVPKTTNKTDNKTVNHTDKYTSTSTPTWPPKDDGPAHGTPEYWRMMINEAKRKYIAEVGSVNDSFAREMANKNKRYG